MKVKYNGFKYELEPIKKPQIFDPPKKMLVWSYREGIPEFVMRIPVIAILPELPRHASVIGLRNGQVWWSTNCAELPERKCSCCGSPMKEGYVIDGGSEYFCSDECLHRHYTPEQYKEMYADGEGDSYWTEFEE